MEDLMLEIRTEQPCDTAAIRLVNEAAFGRTQEADVVEKLHRTCDQLLSLVAIVAGRVVGHLLFSPTVIDAAGGVVEGMGLAPVAVLPEFQRQGIGSALIREGLRLLRHARCPFVIVMGHPEYYPRFGFEPASRLGIRCQWEQVPDDVFMAMILDEQAMGGVTGVALYRREFDEAV